MKKCNLCHQCVLLEIRDLLVAFVANNLWFGIFSSGIMKVPEISEARSEKWNLIICFCFGNNLIEKSYKHS